MDKLEIKQLFYTTNPVFYTRQSVRWKPMFFRTELIFTGFVHPTGMFGNLCCLMTNYVSSRHCFRPVRTSQKYILQLLEGEEVALWLLTSLCISAKREVEVAL